MWSSVKSLNDTILAFAVFHNQDEGAGMAYFLTYFSREYQHPPGGPLTSKAEMNASSSPLHKLHEDHAVALTWLQRLDAAISSIVNEGFSASSFTEIAEIIKYINTDFRRHDEREEKFLFPVIESHSTGMTGSYRAEHRQLWSAFRRLEQSVRDVEMSKIHGSSLRELIDASRAIVMLLRQHIQRENTELLPFAERAMTSEERLLLLNAFAV